MTDTSIKMSEAEYEDYCRLWRKIYDLLPRNLWGLTLLVELLYQHYLDYSIDDPRDMSTFAETVRKSLLVRADKEKMN